ncbi:hypothetical protein DIPPA_07527, partial [Diplonema papillatum]
ERTGRGGMVSKGCAISWSAAHRARRANSARGSGRNCAWPGTAHGDPKIGPATAAGLQKSARQNSDPKPAASWGPKFGPEFFQSSDLELADGTPAVDSPLFAPAGFVEDRIRKANAVLTAWLVDPKTAIDMYLPLLTSPSGSDWLTIAAHANLGTAVLLDGQCARAGALYKESLVLALPLPAPSKTTAKAAVCRNLAVALLLLGDARAALPWLRKEADLRAPSAPAEALLQWAEHAASTPDHTARRVPLGQRSALLASLYLFDASCGTARALSHYHEAVPAALPHGRSGGVDHPPGPAKGPSFLLENPALCEKASAAPLAPPDPEFPGRRESPTVCKKDAVVPAAHPPSPLVRNPALLQGQFENFTCCEKASIVPAARHPPSPLVPNLALLPGQFENAMCCKKASSIVPAAQHPPSPVVSNPALLPGQFENAMCCEKASSIVPAANATCCEKASTVPAAQPPPSPLAPAAALPNHPGHPAACDGAARPGFPRFTAAQGGLLPSAGGSEATRSARAAARVAARAASAQRGSAEGGCRRVPGLGGPIACKEEPATPAMQVLAGDFLRFNPDGGRGSRPESPEGSAPLGKGGCLSHTAGIGPQNHSRTTQPVNQEKEGVGFSRTKPRVPGLDAPPPLSSLHPPTPSAASPEREALRPCTARFHGGAGGNRAAAAVPGSLLRPGPAGKHPAARWRPKTAAHSFAGGARGLRRAAGSGARAKRQPWGLPFGGAPAPVGASSFVPLAGPDVPATEAPAAVSARVGEGASSGGSNRHALAVPPEPSASTTLPLRLDGRCSASAAVNPKAPAAVSVRVGEAGCGGLNSHASTALPEHSASAARPSQLRGRCSASAAVNPAAVSVRLGEGAGCGGLHGHASTVPPEHSPCQLGGRCFTSAAVKPQSPAMAIPDTRRPAQARGTRVGNSDGVSTAAAARSGAEDVWPFEPPQPAPSPPRAETAAGASGLTAAPASGRGGREPSAAPQPTPNSFFNLSNSFQARPSHDAPQPTAAAAPAHLAPEPPGGKHCARSSARRPDTAAAARAAVRTGPESGPACPEALRLRPAAGQPGAKTGCHRLRDGRGETLGAANDDGRAAEHRANVAYPVPVRARPGTGQPEAMNSCGRLREGHSDAHPEGCTADSAAVCPPAYDDDEKAVTNTVKYRPNPAPLRPRPATGQPEAINSCGRLREGHREAHPEGCTADSATVCPPAYKDDEKAVMKTVKHRPNPAPLRPRPATGQPEAISSCRRTREGRSVAQAEGCTANDTTGCPPDDNGDGEKAAVYTAKHGSNAAHPGPLRPRPATGQPEVKNSANLPGAPREIAGPAVSDRGPPGAPGAGGSAPRDIVCDSDGRRRLVKLVAAAAAAPADPPQFFLRCRAVAAVASDRVLALSEPFSCTLAEYALRQRSRSASIDPRHIAQLARRLLCAVHQASCDGSRTVSELISPDNIFILRKPGAPSPFSHAVVGAARAAGGEVSERCRGDCSVALRSALGWPASGSILRDGRPSPGGGGRRGAAQPAPDSWRGPVGGGLQKLQPLPDSTNRGEAVPPVSSPRGSDPPPGESLLEWPASGPTAGSLRDGSPGGGSRRGAAQPAPLSTSDGAVRSANGWRGPAGGVLQKLQPLPGSARRGEAAPPGSSPRGSDPPRSGTDGSEPPPGETLLECRAVVEAAIGWPPSTIESHPGPKGASSASLVSGSPKPGNPLDSQEPDGVTAVYRIGKLVEWLASAGSRQSDFEADFPTFSLRPARRWCPSGSAEEWLLSPLVEVMTGPAAERLQPLEMVVEEGLWRDLGAWPDGEQRSVVDRACRARLVKGYFKQLTRDREGYHVVIHRETLVADVVDALADMSAADDLLRPLTVTFAGENAADFGGLANELCNVFTSEFLSTCASSVSDAGSPAYLPHPTHPPRLLRALGRLLLKCLVDNRCVHLPFPPVFFRFLALPAAATAPLAAFFFRHVPGARGRRQGAAAVQQLLPEPRASVVRG